MNEDSRRKMGRRDGRSKHPLHRRWCVMIQRCYGRSPRIIRGYKDRGITVCARWLSDFWAFVVDMGLPPSPRHSVERMNNDKGYSPDNCVWATPLVQGNNKRTNVRLTVDGVTKTAAQWGRLYGIPGSLICQRKSNGWNDTEAVTTPSQEKHDIDQLKSLYAHLGTISAVSRKTGKKRDTVKKILVSCGVLQQ